MTLLRDFEKQRKLARARARPHLWFTPFSVLDTLEQVRREHFSEIPRRVGVYSVNTGPLACVVGGDSSPSIYVHQVLNHSDTPVEVFNLICKHELLHLRIAHVVEGKRTIQHPPEFWEAEKAISPERSRAWCWIWINLGLCLKKRPHLERIDVLPNWRGRWNRPMLDVSACQQLCGAKAEEAEEEEVVW